MSLKWFNVINLVFFLNYIIHMPGDHGGKLSLKRSVASGRARSLAVAGGRTRRKHYGRRGRKTRRRRSCVKRGGLVL